MAASDCIYHELRDLGGEHHPVSASEVCYRLRAQGYPRVVVVEALVDLIEDGEVAILALTEDGTAIELIQLVTVQA